MNRSRSIVHTAEGGLMVVTLSAVLGMSRLFDGGGWLLPLALNAIAAHLVVAQARRRGLSLPAAAALACVGAAFVTTWISYRTTMALFIPTGDTWTAMQDDLAQAWTLYQDAVAPTPAAPGFVLASSLALWFIAYVADWAAFRLWVPFEATLPAGTLFLFTALLGSSAGRGWAVGTFAAAVLGFLLLHRMARQDSSSHWVADRRNQGHRSLLTAGAALGAVAVLAGTLLGPSVPGADSPGVIDPRSLRESDPSRKAVSPLVDIRSRLVDQSNVEVFRVRSPEPSYWRLTSLERFDGRIWSSSGQYDEADGSLPEAIPSDLTTETFEQTFSIEALAAIWLPSAYEPRAFESVNLDALYEEDSATLIVSEAVDSGDGLAYKVTSASPRITAADLAGSAGDVPDEIRDRFLDLPDDFSPDVRQLAQSLTENLSSPYEQALALQNHLRTFTYDLTVPAGHSDDVLEDFLFNTQRGYCEQFAGAFAAMARSIGLPSRVAVGFTFGESDPDDPTLYHVRGEHAHAWPEVFLAGAGWVSFEPTPGRGMPFAEGYTGVPVSQASTNDPGTATTAPSTTRPATIPTVGTGPQPGARDDQLNTNAGSSGPDDDTAGGSLGVHYLVEPVRRAAPFLGGAGLAYVLIVPLLVLLRRRLRRRGASAPEARIAVAWDEAAEEAELLGYRAVPSDTFRERAARLAAQLPDGAARTAARQLARQMELATYSEVGADELAAELAEESAEALAAAARAAATRAARVLRWVDPRPLVRPWRGDQQTHRRITTTVRGDLEAERELTGSGDRR